LFLQIKKFCKKNIFADLSFLTGGKELKFSVRDDIPFAKKILPLFHFSAEQNNNKFSNTMVNGWCLSAF